MGCLGSSEPRNRSEKQGPAPGEPTRKSYKFLLIGNPEVGKTSLLCRFTDNKFDQKPDLIADGHRTGEIVFERSNGTKTICSIDVWDTAGQEKFRTITSSFYDRSDGIMVVYDILDKSTFDALDQWFQEAGRYARDANLLLVGNKTDKITERTVPFDSAKRFAEKIGIPYIETSPLNGNNVQEAFRLLAKEVLKQKDPTEAEDRLGDSVEAENQAEADDDVDGSG